MLDRLQSHEARNISRGIVACRTIRSAHPRLRSARRVPRARRAVSQPGPRAAARRQLRLPRSGDLRRADQHDRAGVLESTGEPIPPPRLVTEDSLTYWVVQHQQPVVIPLVDSETRFPQAIAYMRSQGMRSACALPLTTPRRPHRTALRSQPGAARLRRGRRDVSGARGQPGRAGDRRRAQLRRAAAGAASPSIRDGPRTSKPRTSSCARCRRCSTCAAYFRASRKSRRR